MAVVEAAKSPSVCGVASQWLLGQERSKEDQCGEVWESNAGAAGGSVWVLAWSDCAGALYSAGKRLCSVREGSSFLAATEVSAVLSSCQGFDQDASFEVREFWDEPSEVRLSFWLVAFEGWTPADCLQSSGDWHALVLSSESGVGKPSCLGSWLAGAVTCAPP